MSEGYLSQDEIDALLQGTDSISNTQGFSPGSPLDDAERNTFKNLLQSTVESQSSNLSMVTSKSVIIGAPNVDLRNKEKLLGELANDLVEIKVDFTEGLVGDHSYIINTKLATSLAGFIMGQTGVELNEAALSGVAEAISNIAGTTVTTIGNQLNQTVMISPADCHKIAKNGMHFPSGDNFVKVEYSISIEGEKPSTLIELYALSTVKEIVARSAGDGVATGQPGVQGNQVVDNIATVPSGSGQTDNEQLLSGFSNMMGPPNVQAVQFPNLQTNNPSYDQGNIGLLMDVFMEMTVELGRTKKLIKDILGIGEGTIIELDKLAGEPGDILVNHKLIAKGEVVVIDENFGVRVTEIVSPMERMSDLK